MKKIILFIALIAGSNSFSQSGLKVGINLSPAWKINLSKQKGTGLRSSENGFGFTAGIPIKYWINEFTAFNTGLDFDFTAFDGYNNGTLVQSFRINALHLPLMFNFHLNGSLYLMGGTGVSYNLSVKNLNVVQSVNQTEVTHKVQPYLGLGVNSLIEKDNGTFEVGVLARYQVLDIWKNTYTPQENFNSHLTSVDFILHYYF